MTKVLQERGVFWWFGEAHDNTASLETSIPGELVISEEGHIELQLEGSLWYEDPDANLGWESRWLPYEKRIAGRLGKYGGTFVLLTDLMRTEFSFADDKPRRQSYDAVLCFTSDFPFPEGFGPESFHSLRIELTGLKEWLQLDSIDVDFPFRKGDLTEFRVSHKNYDFEYKTPTSKVMIENLITGVPFIRRSDSPLAKLDLRQEYWLVYTPTDPATLPELQDAFSRIEEVIALLLGQYFRLDWPNLVGTDGENDVWYKLYSFRGPRTEKPRSSFLLWTTFPPLQESFGTILSTWQAIVEKACAGYELYIASVRKPLPHPEHEFVNLVWAIESLHRSWQRESGDSPEVLKRKTSIQDVLKRFAAPAEKKLKKWLESKLLYAYEPTLEQRIVEVFGRLPFGIETGQLRGFARRCATRRNDISHEGGRRPGEDLESFRTEIQELAAALRYLFHALLLHEIGVAKDVLLKTMTGTVIGERDILPSLRKVQIELPIAGPKEHAT
jgi:hypothetical protein